MTAGGGRRNSATPNAFGCYRTQTQAGDKKVKGGAVVNAWADHENGVLRLSCVPERDSTLNRRCNEIVELPATANVEAPAADVVAPSEEAPAHVDVDGDADSEPTARIGVADMELSVDVGRLCVEVDRSPICRENPGGE